MVVLRELVALTAGVSTPTGLMTNALHAYEAELEPARGDIREQLTTLGAEPGLLHAFLIQWAALSVQLHEPLEQFLAEASRRCAALGKTTLALKLLHIAVHAIDLYRLLADDTRALAQLWNGRRLPHLDLTSLLTQPATQVIRGSHEHQRRMVLGAEPWAELALVFELQSVIASIADKMLEQAARVLGEEVRPGLRTLWLLGQRSITTVDDAMTTFLAAHPEHHEVMVATGLETIELYREFLLECRVAAFNLSSWQARQHA